MPSIEFGLRDVANEVRDRVDPYLAADDSRRTKTIELRDDTPQSLIQRVQEEAADSRQAEADKSGQASLTDNERRRIDFTRPGMNVPKARSIKGIARAEGVDDWIARSDFSLTVDENRRILKNAGGGGRSGMGRTQERTQLQRGARAKEQRREQAEGAKNAAFRGDTEAIGFLDEERAFEDNLFDISLRSEGGPTGTDYERLEDAHGERPQRAQSMDERLSANVTRDPLAWAAAPGQLDFPGIDTVEPDELHAERSERARRQDELEKAPIADSRQQWALAPDQFDWPGVDTPDDRTFEGPVENNGGGLFDL